MIKWLEHGWLALLNKRVGVNKMGFVKTRARVSNPSNPSKRAERERAAEAEYQSVLWRDIIN